MATLSRTQARNSGATAKLSVYQADHQVRYLHLQAQLDTLLIELQARQQQPPRDPSPLR